MKRIHKGHPPRSFTVWLKEDREEPLRYSDLKDPLREEVVGALVREQGGLCAYCNERVGEPSKPATIEHYVAQSDPTRGREFELEWKNWLAVCVPRSKVHCDKSRGPTPLLLRPSRELVPSAGLEHLKSKDLDRFDAEQLIAFKNDGTMFIDPERAHRAGLDAVAVARMQGELDKVLRLNDRFLRERRLGVLQAARNALEMAHRREPATTQWRREKVEEVLRTYLGTGERGEGKNVFKPHCMIAVYYLLKKLNKIPS